MRMTFGLVPKNLGGGNRKEKVKKDLEDYKSEVVEVEERKVKYVNEIYISSDMIRANAELAKDIPPAVRNLHRKIITSIYRGQQGKGWKLKEDAEFIVCRRWINIKHFNDDLSKLPHYKEWTDPDNRMYQASLVVYGSNCYSPETLCIIRREHNLSYINNLMYIVERGDVKKFFISNVALAVFIGVGNPATTAWKNNQKLGETFTTRGYDITIVKGLYRIKGTDLLTPSDCK